MYRPRTTTISLLLPLTAAVLSAGCLGDTSTGPTNGPGDASSFVAFVSDRSVNADVFRVNLDGTELRQVTGVRGRESQPDCSPAGTELLLTSEGRDGPEKDIFLLTGTGVLQRLTMRQGQGEDDSSPAWSPDGDEIAFVTTGRSQFGGAANRVATLNVNTLVVEGVGADVRGVSLDWSTAGHGLAVASEGASGNGDLDLLRVDPGGTVQVLSGDPSVSETHPAWSGSGDWVAFTMQDPDGTGGDIYRVRADGSDLRQLTTDDAADVHPTVSADGTQIAFASDRSGNFEIHVMDADGGNVRQVTDHPARDDQPTWCEL